MDKSSGGSVTRTITYYPAGGAMRINSTLYYILKDHLGSASVITNSTGAVVGEQRYYPFGETRLTTGTIFTDQLFTGQREMTGLGIYHYNARFYSPKLGRFLSADRIVPDPANPQDLNRYSYVRNSPLRYTDPSGHKCVGESAECLNDNTGRLINGVGTFNNTSGGSTVVTTTTTNNNNNNNANKGGGGGKGGGIQPSPIITPAQPVTPSLLPLDPFAGTVTSTDSGDPDWETIRTVALIAGGTVLIVGGLLLTGVGVGLIVFAGAGLAEVAVGAAGAAVAGRIFTGNRHFTSSFSTCWVGRHIFGWQSDRRNCNAMIYQSVKLSNDQVPDREPVLVVTPT